MPIEFLAIFGVFCFAAFQSVAGVGLLLFGTPTLLLLGYPFDETLAILVPTSLAISLLQLVSTNQTSVMDVMRFSLKTTPPLIAGLSAVLLLGFENQLHFPIAAALAGAAILQIANLFRKRPMFIPQRVDWMVVGSIGLLHGLTNLGGGFLAAYSAIGNSNRVAVRNTIALGYSIFAVIQILLLVVLSPESFSVLTAWSVFVGVAVYYLLGKKLFAATSEHFFKILMPVVTIVFCLSVFSAGISQL